MKCILKNGGVVEIPQKDIDNLKSSLELTTDEAIELWLSDNEYEVNTEQQELDKKAKNVKINRETGRKVSNSPKKPINVKVSDEKKDFFNALNGFLMEYSTEKGGKCEILTQNKLFSVKIGDKIFKVDLIQQRNK